ncbi:SDR family NAD(P)-dependent oxidoreductase [Legionella sp. CNM-4043-24]|uniref:SDR family NAD(P)-dependent oxidoreductase n=1 Tax=Legionella sp. CNM-4043-24 TaxID=3421646 RepID=UPI00403A8E5B
MNKVILITGSSTGIGALTATDLSQDNQIIIQYFSSRDSAEEVAADVEKNGGIPYLIKADLASEEGCQQLASFIENQFGKLDILINNAGGLDERHSASEITWPLLEKIFHLNAFSTMYLTSLCIPLLHRSMSPCIVNITSVSMRTGAPTATVYAAAKAAIDSFTRGLAHELAPKIRVNAIAPGYINTPFHHGLTSEEELKSIAAMTPLSMIGEPRHITSAIKLLIENDFITGETIDVNGGLFMR